MKRFIFTLLIVSVGLGLNAQSFPDTPPAVYTSKKAPGTSKVKYRASVDASIRFGTPTVGRYGLTMVNGVAIGDYVSIGLGAGVLYYTQRYYKETTQVTLFLHGETNLVNPKDKKVVPYVSANIGMSSINSFLAEPSVGIKFPLDSHRAIKLSVGYNYEHYCGGLSKMWEPAPGGSDGVVIIDEDTQIPTHGTYVRLDDVRDHLSGVIISLGFQF